MQFHRSDPPRTAAEFRAVNRRWESLGWTPMTPDDEANVRASWIERLQPGRALVLPVPRRTWDTRPLRGLADAERVAVEADLTLKALDAFRRITPSGGVSWPSTGSINGISSIPTAGYRRRRGMSGRCRSCRTGTRIIS